MNAPDPIRTSMLTVASLTLLVAFAVKCTSGSPDDRPITGLGNDTAAVQGVEHTSASDHGSATTASATTPTVEQQEALARHHLLDIRMRLESELVIVRAALNDETLPPARQTQYQKQAADLGNNIAQLDAARNEMEMATPENTVMAHQHAAMEVAEVERWLEDYQKKDETASLHTSNR